MIGVCRRATTSAYTIVVAASFAGCTQADRVPTDDIRPAGATPTGWAGGPMYKQSIGSWQPVAYLSTDTTFCLFSSSNAGSGTFAGTVAWD